MTSYLLSGPAAEPVTLDDAHAVLRLDDTAEDALISTLLMAARLHVEAVTSQALIAQTWRLALDGWPPDRTIRLPVGPLLSLTSITAHDSAGGSTDLDASGVLSDAASGPPLLFLPADFDTGAMLRQRQGIAIDYVAGYGADASDVPALLRQAILLLVAYWFENRDSLVVAGSGAAVPSGFDLMLAPYRAVRL